MKRNIQALCLTLLFYTFAEQNNVQAGPTNIGNAASLQINPLEAEEADPYL